MKKPDYNPLRMGEVKFANNYAKKLKRYIEWVEKLKNKEEDNL